MLRVPFLELKGTLTTFGGLLRLFVQDGPIPKQSVLELVSEPEIINFLRRGHFRNQSQKRINAIASPATLTKAV